jgi:L-alanine-DL-glutamate epimerase-like enolase superfamily enzyme
VTPGAEAAPADRAEAIVLSGLARGRALFNRADFWASHEAWEPGWAVAAAPDRAFLQGLIQAAAAFHKYVVQDNPHGAGRLLHRALSRLDTAPPDHRGLALDAFRAELRGWQARLAEPGRVVGPVLGLPRLEWAGAGQAARLDVEAVDLYRVEVDGRWAILVSVETATRRGWGECRLRWEAHGVWASLTEALVPALLADPVAAPSELPVRWQGLASNPCAAAGLEAAVWDLWSQELGLPLVGALGHGPRPVSLLGCAEGTSVEELRIGVRQLAEQGFAAAMVPARPNADRRLLPSVVAGSPLPLAFDLGESYRMADIKALVVLDGLGARWLARPFPSGDLAQAVRLARLLETPVSLGGWTQAEALAGALSLGALDVVELDPGVSGLTEAVRLVELASAHRADVWVESSAATEVGAASDLALAAHPGVRLPSSLSSAAAMRGGAAVCPDAGGCAVPSGTIGLGVVPPDSWLRGATRQHARLSA